MTARLVLAVVIACAAATVAAQQFYRWTDESGRVHITDTPPPPGAKNVRRPKPAAADEPAEKPAPGAAAKPEALPFSVQRAMKEFPVTLYTSPNCAQPCLTARDLLNTRGVTFSEVQVFDEDGVNELKKLSGGIEVPVLKVGASVYAGFQRSAYDALLDSAGYPAAGVLPPRGQKPPPVPEGYTVNPPAPPRAEPLTPPKAPAGSGPYSPK